MLTIPTRHFAAASLAALTLLVGCSRQTAEEKGTAMATEKLDMAKGIGDAMEKKGEAASEAVMGGISTVLRGAHKGMNKLDMALVADASLKEAGLSVPSINAGKPVETPAASEEASSVSGKGASKGADKGASKAAEPAPAPSFANSYDLYVVAEKAAIGRLRVTAYDMYDKEVGRAHVDIERDADDAKFSNVKFDERVDMSKIKKLSFQFKPAAVLANK